MREIFKYSGAGNDFLMIDGRRGVSCPLHDIRALCNRESGFRAADGRIGSDGLIVITDSSRACFRMEFYNPDGTSGMMCGNGGRCAVAFAHFLGIRPSDGEYLFEAPDGLHSARILSMDGYVCTVRLKMVDATGMKPVLDGWFINTGTRHYVARVPDVEAVDVATEGAALRFHPFFAPEGANVNFVQVLPDSSLKVRTFEKGVEAETLACGTGAVASAIVFGNSPALVHARISDLEVEFTPAEGEFDAVDVWLTGPAERIA